MKMIKEGNLKISERKKEQRKVKIWVNVIEILSHLEFSKLCQLVEQKL